MIEIRVAAAGALLLACSALPAQAAQPKKAAGETAAAAPTVAPAGALGTAGAWSAYASSDRTGRVCYLVGKPEKSEAAGLSRKEPSAMVTHRPAENISNVVSFVEGYPLKEGSEVILEVGGKKFELFTKNDSAWAPTAELDRTVVTALARAKSAVVKGQPAKGRPTVDVYSLAGFPKALALIDRACGVQRETEKPAPRAPAQHHKRSAKPKPKQG